MKYPDALSDLTLARQAKRDAVALYREAHVRLKTQHLQEQQDFGDALAVSTPSGSAPPQSPSCPA